jgi:hypothetical protein
MKLKNTLFYGECARCHKKKYDTNKKLPSGWMVVKILQPNTSYGERAALCIDCRPHVFDDMDWTAPSPGEIGHKFKRFRKVEIY